VVLSGEGRAFCAGLDKSGFEAILSGDDAASEVIASTLSTRTHGIANRPQYAVWIWRELPVPVIAAVHGAALGGGFQLMLGADMRYAAPDTRMSILEIKWGLVPDMAGSQLLRHLVRDDVARELTYSGRMITTEEAAQLGLVTRICDAPHSDAMEIARQIAARNPDAIRADKELFNQAPYLSTSEGLLHESRLQDNILKTPNQVEAVKAELEGRPARYK
jgi:enoyl-CoA hydratase/carnithine racemase